MNIKEFLLDNYIWIMVVIVILIITVIGFLVDKNKNPKDKKEKKEKNKKQDNVSTIENVDVNKKEENSNNNVNVAENTSVMPEQGLTVQNPVINNGLNNNNNNMNFANVNPVTSVSTGISSVEQHSMVQPNMMQMQNFNDNSQIATPRPVVPTPISVLERPVQQGYQSVQMMQPQSIPTPVMQPVQPTIQQPAMSQQNVQTIPQSVNIQNQQLNNMQASYSMNNVNPQQNNIAQNNVGQNNVGQNNQIPVNMTPMSPVNFVYGNNSNVNNDRQ